MSTETKSRAFVVRADTVDAESGTFEAAVFTGGEASDGHILNIAGGKTESRIPLFINHEADPRSQLGSLHFVRRADDEMIYRGEVSMDLEGTDGDMRRNLVRMMADGHIGRLSGRWDYNAKDATRRVNLPKDHPAFVKDSADGPKRFGLYFEKWHAMEGSVVGLGADPAATVRMLTTGKALQPVERDDLIELAEDPAPKSAAERFAEALADLKSEGMESEALVRTVADALDFQIPEALAEEAAEADEDDSNSFEDLRADIDARLDAFEEKMISTVRDLLPERQVEVAPTAPNAVAAEHKPDAVATATAPERTQPVTLLDLGPEKIGSLIREIFEDNERRVLEVATTARDAAMGKLQK